MGFEPTHGYHRLFAFQANLFNQLEYPSIIMAERVGFEPTEAVNFGGLVDRSFKPLTHLSV